MVELSVTEIMKKIKYESEKQKDISEIQIPPMTDDLFAEEYKDIIKHKNIIFEIKDTYEYSDFTKYHDIEFMTNLYKAILKREPDQQGMTHYLNLLRSGKKSKSEIISIVRYSQEGKRIRVNILGINKRYIYTALSSIPIFGYLFRLLVTFFRLPILLQRLNSYENYVIQESKFNYENCLLLEAELNLKIKELKKVKTILKMIKDKI